MHWDNNREVQAKNCLVSLKTNLVVNVPVQLDNASANSLIKYRLVPIARTGFNCKY